MSRKTKYNIDEFLYEPNTRVLYLLKPLPYNEFILYGYIDIVGKTMTKKFGYSHHYLNSQNPIEVRHNEYISECKQFTAILIQFVR